jgi:hypothetical protein
VSRLAVVTLVALVGFAALAGCKAKQSAPPSSQGSGSAEPAPPPPAAPPSIDRAALLDGKLPEGAPEVELINAQCRICHTTEYLTQQRLSEAAWTKTITKMKKFGANVSDADVAALAKFAATYWNPDLPPRTNWKLVGPPAGALPLADR